MIDNIDDFKAGYDRDVCDDLILSFCETFEEQLSDFSSKHFGNFEVSAISLNAEALEIESFIFPFNDVDEFDFLNDAEEDLLKDYPYSISDALRENNYDCRRIDGCEIIDIANENDCILVGMLNIRGLSCHLEQLRPYFEDSCVDILGISETHLADSVFDNFLKLKGYDIFRHDRLNNNVRTWGGLAIYVKTNINANVIYTSKGVLEFMIMKIACKKTNILVCLVYRPHCTNFDDFSELEDSLVDLMQQDSKLFLFGDFNINVIHDVSLKKKFELMIDRLNCFFIPTFTTRHSNNCRSSFIDMFLSNSPNLISFGYQSNLGRISDHEGEYL